eukprot:6511865-Prymnesium_polylepis.1
MLLASVTCDATRSCELQRGGGRSATASAWAALKLSGNSTGWSELHIESREGEDDATAAFGAGFVEGALTTVGNWQQWRNYYTTTFNSPADPIYVESSRFLQANDDFMRDGCREPSP